MKRMDLSDFMPSFQDSMNFYRFTQASASLRPGLYHLVSSRLKINSEIRRIVGVWHFLVLAAFAAIKQNKIKKFQSREIRRIEMLQPRSKRSGGLGKTIKIHRVLKGRHKIDASMMKKSKIPSQCSQWLCGKFHKNFGVLAK